MTELRDAAAFEAATLEAAVDRGAPLIPRNSIAARALVVVVAIMTFLACLTAGSALLVAQASQAWRSDVLSDVMIQVKPGPEDDVDRLVDRVVAIAAARAGADNVHAYSADNSRKLLRPWLGDGLDLDASACAPHRRGSPRRRRRGHRGPPGEPRPRRPAGRSGRSPGLGVADRGHGRRDRFARHGDVHPRDRRHGHRDRFRDPWRGRGEPRDRRGSAFRRRLGPVCRQPVSQPFPAAGVSGRGDRRRIGDRLLPRRGRAVALVRQLARAAPRSRPCSAPSRSGPTATPGSFWSRASSRSSPESFPARSFFVTYARCNSANKPAPSP